MHWLGPYVITFVKDVGVVQLETLNGKPLGGVVNGSRLILYRDNPLFFQHN